VFPSDHDPNANKCNGRTFTALSRRLVRLLESHPAVTTLDGKESLELPAKVHLKDRRNTSQPDTELYGICFQPHFDRGIKLPAHNYP